MSANHYRTYHAERSFYVNESETAQFPLSYKPRLFDNFTHKNGREVYREEQKMSDDTLNLPTTPKLNAHFDDAMTHQTDGNFMKSGGNNCVDSLTEDFKDLNMFSMNNKNRASPSLSSVSTCASSTSNYDLMEGRCGNLYDIGQGLNTMIGMKKTKKVVRFTMETKTWDGVRPAHNDFDELLFRFLIKETPVGDKTLLRWTQANYKRILSMCFLVNDLIYRIRTQPPATPIPCLPMGGGRALRVESSYEPFICSLRNVLLKALTESFRVNGVVFDGSNTNVIEVEKVYEQLRHEVRMTERIERIAADIEDDVELVDVVAQQA